MSVARSRILAGIALLAASQFAARETQAQMGGFQGIVEGFIAAAQMQAAQEAWSHVPELRQYCFQRALSRHNASIAGLIRAGIAPGDPRLSSVATQCSRFEPSALRSNYRCTITDESGNDVPSTCNQGFARQEGSGRLVPVDTRTAIDTFFGNGDLRLVDVESPAGRQERLHRIETQRLVNEIARLRAEIERFRASRSEVVRNQTQNRLQRVASANIPSASTVDAIRRDAEMLRNLEMLELGRLAALEKLNAVKADVDRRALSPTFPPSLREPLAQLQSEYASLAGKSITPPAAPPAAAFDRVTGPAFDCAKARLLI